MLIHPQFDPIAVAIGPLAVRWYGLMYLLAFLQFWWLGRRRIQAPVSSVARHWTTEELDDLIFFGVLGVILGGRLGEILEAMSGTAQHLHAVATTAGVQSDNIEDANKALDEIRIVAEQTSGNMQVLTAALLTFQGGMEELDMIVNAMVSGDYERAASSKFVQWTSSMDLGLDDIDSQHRMLVDYINDLHSAMSNHRSASELLEILHKLRNYTSTHFRDEEKHFVHTDYPLVKDHLKIHREFEAKVDEVERGIKEGTVTLSMDLLSFLKDWLVKHIMGMDTQYVPYVKKSASAAAMSKSRAS